MDFESEDPLTCWDLLWGATVWDSRVSIYGFRIWRCLIFGILLWDSRIWGLQSNDPESRSTNFGSEDPVICPAAYTESLEPGGYSLGL